MTLLDQGPVRILTPAVQGDAATTDALSFAVRRDLVRLTEVLPAPVTAVRRAALVGHCCFVLDQLQAHQRVLDAVVWPAVCAVRPELGEIAGRVELAHRELAGPIAAVRDASVAWGADPDQRLTLLSAVRELLPALAPVLELNWEFAPFIDDVLTTDSPEARPPMAAWFSAPTRLARRTFWLLDDLDPRRADLLTRRTPRTVMWILRNGFSGAYNRSAYLMWVGGGTGPAV